MHPSDRGARARVECCQDRGKRNDTKYAFEKSTFRQYWIVNKKEKSEYYLDTLTKLARYSNVYGPFKKRDYLRKREELNVPKKLVLKE